MVEKRVESKGDRYKDLSEGQSQVLHLLTHEHLTVKQAAIRRGTTDKAVYKIRAKLIKKGLLNSAYGPVESVVEKTGVTFQPPHLIRLHGQRFHINILYKDKRYKALKEKSNLIYIDGNTVMLHRDSVELFSGHSFYADDPQKATAKSFEYWNRMFNRLEHDLNIIVRKDRYQNIKLVNHHYAEVNNELAQESEKKGYKIRVYTTDTGKLWFAIDNSFNLHEAETQGETAAEDMQDAVMPFFNDLRDNKPPKLSEIMGVIAQHAEINKETAAGLNSVVKLLKINNPEPREPEKGLERPEYIQ